MPSRPLPAGLRASTSGSTTAVQGSRTADVTTGVRVSAGFRLRAVGEDVPALQGGPSATVEA